ncbi:MAG: LicD family protein [Synergistaceae bacterium]|nr:LicD family protein [Synergistaceae bacterium]
MNNNVDIKRVQDVLLRTGKCTAEILERHDIPYMLIFGTLLGAVRHKGFIPWDDDFDLMLFDDSYEQAVNFLRQELPDDLFLEDEKSEPLYFHAWAHVKDLKSKAVCMQFPQDSLYSHCGISIDLYRTKRIQKYRLSDYLNDENFAYIQRRKKKGLITDEDFSRRMAALEQSREASARERSGDMHEVFALLTAKCGFLEPEEIFPLRRFRFEDTEFWGPANPEVILSKFYGDFMRLPPVEERLSHYSSVEFF